MTSQPSSFAGQLNFKNPDLYYSGKMFKFNDFSQSEKSDEILASISTLVEELGRLWWTLPLINIFKFGPPARASNELLSICITVINYQHIYTCHQFLQYSIP